MRALPAPVLAYAPWGARASVLASAFASSRGDRDDLFGDERPGVL
jgi:hypothetical protein